MSNRLRKGFVYAGGLITLLMSACAPIDYKTPTEPTKQMQPVPRPAPRAEEFHRSEEECNYCRETDTITIEGVSVRLVTRPRDKKYNNNPVYEVFLMDAEYDCAYQRWRVEDSGKDGPGSPTLAGYWMNGGFCGNIYLEGDHVIGALMDSPCDGEKEIPMINL